MRMSIEKYQKRNDRIHALRALDMGVTEIASELGLTVGTVAGVIFRHDRAWWRGTRLDQKLADANLGRIARRAGLTIADIRDIAQSRTT